MNYGKKYTKNHEIYGAILIEEKIFEGFIQFIGKNFKKIEFLGKTNDNTRIAFMDLNDLLSYPNNKNKYLISLNITASDDEKVLDITLNNLGFIRPQILTYTLSYNDEKWGYKFDDDLQFELNEFKPWYSLITYFPITYTLPVIIILLLLSYVGFNFLLESLNLPTYLTIHINDPVEKTKKGDLLFLLWIIPLYGICYTIEVSRNYLFPRLFIATGKRVKEFQKRKIISYIFFVFLIGGILVNKFSDLF